MIKVVVFDLGKVLVDFDYSIAIGKIAARSKASPEEVQRLLAETPLLVKYETGELSSRQFYREACQATGFQGTFEEFSAIFSDIFTEIPEMVGFHAELRSRSVPTFIFSNTNELAVNHIHSSFPFFHSFSDYIYSYKVGAMKPDHRIYEEVERRCGFRENEILYIDDRPENIETGEARGWTSICHASPDTTLSKARPLVFGQMEG